METVGYAALQIVPSMKGFRAALEREVRTQVGDVLRPNLPQTEENGKKAGRSFTKGALSALRTSTRVIATAAAAGFAAAAAGLTALGVSGLKAASDFQQASVSFETLLGSAEKAQGLISDLRDFAKTTPFELPGLTEASQKLLGFGFAADEVIPILTAAGDAAAGLGRGQEGVQQIVRALGQIQAKGKVQGDELLQLSEIGVNGLGILADALGKTTAETSKMIAQGLVPADFAIQALVSGIENGTKSTAAFGGLMEKQALTLQGVMSNLKDSVTIALTDGLTPALPTLAAAISALQPTLSSFASTFATVLAPTLTLLAQTVLPPLAQLLATSAPLFNAVFAALANAAGPILTALLPAFQQLVPALQQVVGVLGGSLAQIAANSGPYLVTLATSFGQLLVALAPLVPLVTDFAVAALPAMTTALDLSSRGIGATGAALVAFGGFVLDAARNLIVLVSDGFAGLLDAMARVQRAIPGMSGVADATQRAADSIRNFAATSSANIDTMNARLQESENRLGALAQGVTIPLTVTATYVNTTTLEGILKASGRPVAPSVSVPAYKPPATYTPPTGGRSGRSTGGGGASPAEQLRTMLKDAAQAIAGGDFKKITDLIAQVRKTFSGAKERSLIARLIGDRKELKGLASDLKQVTRDLDRAKQRLANLRQEKKSTASSIRAGINDTLQLSSLVRSDGQALPDASTLRAYAADKVAKARALVTAVKKLIKAGLSGSLIRQIIAAGPDAGLALANALLAAPSSIKELSAATDELDDLAKTLGDSAASYLYDAGIASAEGLVQGLKDKKKEIEDTMLAIAKGMVSAIKKALGIKSPSRVFAGLGGYVGDGFVLGVERKTGRAQDALLALTAPPSPSSFASSSGSVPGGMAQPIIKPAPVYLDGRQVSEVVFSHGGRDYGYGRTA